MSPAVPGGLPARARSVLGAGSWGAAAPLLLAWLAAMLATPFVEQAGGVPARTGWILVTVALQAATAVALVARATGARRALRMLAPVPVITFLAEFVGSQTGVPFGRYHYTDLLAPHLGGVPLAIPFAWVMLLPSAWAVARVLAGRWGGPAFVGLSALALTAWDLFLDPQMVAWGIWAWDQPGEYFGIPLVNFAGWLLVTALVTVVARPAGLAVRPLLVLYALVCVTETVGLAVFWGLAGPAAAGAAVMGTLAVLAWRAELRAPAAADVRPAAGAAAGAG